MINNFIKRAITGVLFVAILVGCILYDAFSFGILFTVISALTIYEFAQLVNMRAEGVKINKTINMLGGAYLFLAIMGRFYRRRSCSNRSVFYTCSLLPIYVNDGMGRTGIGSGYIRYMGRPDGVIAKTPIARKGFGKYSSGTWRDARSV